MGSGRPGNPLGGHVIDALKLEPRTSRYGCGIYEAGDTDRCYVKLFVTDDGFVLPVNHRVISEDDLMEVYVQGRMCRDVSHAIDVLADLMESGGEIGEMVEKRREEKHRQYPDDGLIHEDEIPS